MIFMHVLLSSFLKDLVLDGFKKSLGWFYLSARAAWRCVCVGAGLSSFWPLKEESLSIGPSGGGNGGLAGTFICCCWFGQMSEVVWSSQVMCVGSGVRSRSWRRLRR